MTIVFHAYLLSAIALTWNRNDGWCYNVRLLTLLTLLAYILLTLCSVSPKLNGFLFGDLCYRIAAGSQNQPKEAPRLPCVFFHIVLCLEKARNLVDEKHLPCYALSTQRKRFTASV